MSFSNFITLAFFSIISYMTCGLIGETWKDTFAFGRWTDQFRSYAGIFYSSVTLTLVQLSILHWCFGYGEISLPSKYLWILFGIGAFFIIFTAWAGSSYRDVSIERLTRQGFCKRNQISSIVLKIESIGWTFNDLPQFLDCPNSNTREHVDSRDVTEEDPEELEFLVEERGMNDDLDDKIGAVVLFILRTLFRIIFAGFLISCSIVRSSARNSHSQIEACLDSLPEEQVPPTS